MTSRRTTDKPGDDLAPKLGKRPRRKHWIYDVEKALGLSHVDIARLLTPEPLSIAAVRDICHSFSGTAALKGLSFPIDWKTISDIIAGESDVWERKAVTLLRQRLGVIAEEYFQTGEIFAYDDQPFGRESLRRYLADAERQQKTPFLAGLSYFAQPKPPVTSSRRKPSYIDPRKGEDAKKKHRKQEK